MLIEINLKMTVSKGEEIAHAIHITERYVLKISTLRLEIDRPRRPLARMSLSMTVQAIRCTNSRTLHCFIRANFQLSPQIK